MAKIEEGGVLLQARTAAEAVPDLIARAGGDRTIIIDGLASSLVAHVAGRVVESQAGVYGADPLQAARLVLDLAMRCDVALTAGRMSRS